MSHYYSHRMDINTYRSTYIFCTCPNAARGAQLHAEGLDPVQHTLALSAEEKDEIGPLPKELEKDFYTYLLKYCDNWK